MWLKKDKTGKIKEQHFIVNHRPVGQMVNRFYSGVTLWDKYQKKYHSCDLHIYGIQFFIYVASYMYIRHFFLFLGS